ncbi:MAG: 50S ribosomal protein L22 [Candidatus Margulisbacteria bacterium]|nr:50S ribosomal protein L22 [Candidatus Margulisiibacteriota bacterium]
MTIIKAKAKWVKSSDRKLSRVIELIRGKTALEAMTILKFRPQKGARILEKVLKSAIANAKHNLKLDENSLLVKEAYANKGIIMRRFQPRARGRAFPIKKKTSHVTVCLSSAEEK